MLRIDNQRARSRDTKPGSDRGFSKRQRRDPVRRRKSRAGLRLGGAGSAPSAISETIPATLKAELAGQPDPGIVRQAGRTLRNITEGAIGSLLAASAQPGLWHWIQQKPNAL